MTCLHETLFCVILMTLTYSNTRNCSQWLCRYCSRRNWGCVNWRSIDSFFQKYFPFYRKAQICQCQTHKILEKKMKVFFFNKEQKSIRFHHQLKQKFVVIVQSKAYVVSFIIRNLVNIQFSISIAMPLLYYCTYNRKLFHLVQQKWRNVIIHTCLFQFNRVLTR